MKHFSTTIALSSCAFFLASCSHVAEPRPHSEAVTVPNCGRNVTFEHEPSRILLTDPSAVPVLQAFGKFDRVVARAGAFPEDYFAADTNAKIATIPSLVDDLDATGHLQLSIEAILQREPDLLLGSASGVKPGSLEKDGVNEYVSPLFCPNTSERASFDSLYGNVETQAKIFHTDPSTYVELLKYRVDKLTASTHHGTAAVVYPTVGGGTLYAYGARSMANPLVQAAGFDNVFGRVDDRVFELSSEELLRKDPDVIIALYSEGDRASVAASVGQLPGADSLGAVREGKVMPLLLHFVEPASPLAVDGLEKITTRFSR